MKDRIAWIDFAKGIAIFLVVLGHVLDGPLGRNMYSDCWIQVLYDGINSFHMPLFFILSGAAIAVSNHELKWARLGRGSMNLLILYVFWSGCSYACKHLFAGYVTHVYEESFIYCLFLKPVDPFWYFFVLSMYYILLFSCRKIINISMIVAGIISGLAPLVQEAAGLWAFRIVFYYFFLLLGYNGFKYLNMKCPYKNIGWILQTVAVLLLALVSLQNTVLKVPFVKVIVSSIISIAVIFACSKLSQKTNPINKYIELMGENSIYIYTMHIFVIILFRTLYVKQKVIILPSVAYIVINTIITIWGCMMAMVLIKRTKFLDLFFYPVRTIKNTNHKVLKTPSRT